MSDKLSKTDILLETFIQCISFAEENKNEQIDELEEIEIFWENLEGMEFSVDANLIEVTKGMADKINELSHFIRSTLDPTKCYPDGIPDIATE